MLSKIRGNTHVASTSTWLAADFRSTLTTSGEWTREIGSLGSIRDTFPFIDKPYIILAEAIFTKRNYQSLEGNRR